MSTTQKPTPETDYHAKLYGSGDAVIADFARKLERERDEAREELGELRDKINSLEFRISQEKHLNSDHEQDYLAVWKLIKRPDETVVQAAQRLKAENEAMREAIKEAHGFITSLEYEGNEKGTRCISCYSHCSESHRPDCTLQTALAKLQPFITP